MNAAQFIAKWQQVALTERSAAQQHFLDLCDLVGHPKPADADPKGEWFTFERGAAKQAGGEGWAVGKRSSTWHPIASREHRPARRTTCAGELWSARQAQASR